eukprot:3076433-Rhodomonas_salina.1
MREISLGSTPKDAGRGGHGPRPAGCEFCLTLVGWVLLLLSFSRPCCPGLAACMRVILFSFLQQQVQEMGGKATATDISLKLGTSVDVSRSTLFALGSVCKAK